MSRAAFILTISLHVQIQNQSWVTANGGGWNRMGRREKWPKKSWEEGEKEKLGVGRIELDGPGWTWMSREEGGIGFRK